MSVVTLLEAKAHLRVLDSDDDVYIQDLVNVAEAQAEEITSRYLSEKSDLFELEELKEVFELPKSPLVAVDSIEYYSERLGSYTVLDTSLYKVSTTSSLAKVKLDLNVDYIVDVFFPLKVTYRAGYAVLPAPIKQWILLRVATMYENREEIVVGPGVSKIENDYNDYLISKYRVGRL